MKRHGVFLLLVERDASALQPSLSLSGQSSPARAKRGGERTKRETPASPLPRKDEKNFGYVFNLRALCSLVSFLLVLYLDS